MLDFGSAWKVSSLGSNYILVHDSKFNYVVLVWSRAHLQCFPVVLIGQPGLTQFYSVFLRIHGTLFYHYVLEKVTVGHMKVI